MCGFSLCQICCGMYFKIVGKVKAKYLLTVCWFRNAPMFRSSGLKGKGVGLARGKATVQRASKIQKTR